MKPNQSVTTHANPKLFDPELLMERIAQAHGFELYRHYSESEASKLLQVHASTLKRARADQKIGFIRKGVKSVAYFGFNLAEYLLSNSTWPQHQKEPTS